jgi:hypothetical protein
MKVEALLRDRDTETRWVGRPLQVGALGRARALCLRFTRRRAEHHALPGDRCGSGLRARRSASDLALPIAIETTCADSVRAKHKIPEKARFRTLDERVGALPQCVARGAAPVACSRPRSHQTYLHSSTGPLPYACSTHACDFALDLQLRWLAPVCCCRRRVTIARAFA